MGLSLGTRERVRNGHGNRAIGVRAIEVLFCLELVCHLAIHTFKSDSWARIPGDSNEYTKYINIKNENRSKLSQI